MTDRAASRRRARSVLLVAAALLTACGGDDDATPATTTETAEASTTTTTSTSTTLATACDPVVRPEGAEELSELPGDVDGDDAPDRLRTYRVGADWHLEVELAKGGGAELALPSLGGGVGVIGGADVDGDGADEVWAQTGAGASATIVGLARVVGCALERVTFASGEPAELAVGGSVGTAAGVECSTPPDGPARLTGFTATIRDDSGYDVLATHYHLEGTTLVEDDSETITVAAGDPDLLRYTSFSCGDLVR